MLNDLRERDLMNTELCHNKRGVLEMFSKAMKQQMCSEYLASSVKINFTAGGKEY